MDIRDSINFLSISRTILASIANKSQVLTESQKYSLKNYLVNEATDYQILHFLVHEKGTEEKYNREKELELLNFLNVALKEALKDYFPEDILNECFDMIPLSVVGLSTQKPILEHYVALQELNKYQQAVIDIFRQNPFTAGGALAGGTIDAALRGIGKLIGNPIKMASKLTGAEKGLVGLLGGAAIASGLIAASKKLYDRFWSEAAEACKGKKGKEKTKCMKKYKIDALQKQASSLSSAIKACADTKHPKKCRSEIQDKIDKLRKRVKDLK